MPCGLPFEQHAEVYPAERNSLVCDVAPSCVRIQVANSKVSRTAAFSTRPGTSLAKDSNHVDSGAVSPGIPDLTAEGSKLSWTGFRKVSVPDLPYRNLQRSPDMTCTFFRSIQTNLELKEDNRHHFRVNLGDIGYVESNTVGTERNHRQQPRKRITVFEILADHQKRHHTRVQM